MYNVMHLEVLNFRRNMYVLVAMVEPNNFVLNIFVASASCNDEKVGREVPQYPFLLHAPWLG
jgi:hypothetical protein